MKYGKQVHKNKLKNTDELEKELLRIEKDLMDKHDKALLKRREEVISLIEKYYIEKARGAQVRARETWIDDGERSTKYFFNLERKRQANNVIGALKVGGKRITNMPEILKEEVNYYKG